MPATLIYMGREDTIRPHLFDMPEGVDLMFFDDLAAAAEDLNGRAPNPDTDGGPFLVAYGPDTLAAAGAHAGALGGIDPQWGPAVALLPDPPLSSPRAIVASEVWLGIVLLDCHHAVTMPRGLTWLHALLLSNLGGVR